MVLDRAPRRDEGIGEADEGDELAAPKELRDVAFHGVDPTGVGVIGNINVGFKFGLVPAVLANGGLVEDLHPQVSFRTGGVERAMGFLPGTRRSPAPALCRTSISFPREIVPAEAGWTYGMPRR